MGPPAASYTLRAPSPAASISEAVVTLKMYKTPLAPPPQTARPGHHSLVGMLPPRERVGIKNGVICLLRQPSMPMAWASSLGPEMVVMKHT